MVTLETFLTKKTRVENLGQTGKEMSKLRFVDENAENASTDIYTFTTGRKGKK